MSLDPTSMSTFVIQLIFPVVLFFLLILSLVLPFWLFRRIDGSEKTTSVMSYCNCASAGVFIGVLFIGLIPLVYDKFQDIFREMHIVVDYPLTETSIVFGFFLILTLEQSLHICQEKENEHRAGGESGHLINAVAADNLSSDKESDNEETALSIETSTKSKLRVFTKRKKKSKNDTMGHLNHGSHGHSHASAFTSDSILRSAILMTAMGVHGIFEGLTIGLQDDMKKLLNIYIGVLIHECIVSVAVGISLAKTNIKFSTMLKLGFIFCLTNPVGIVLGLIIGKVQTAGGLIASGIIQGLAAGSFIHVIFCEIIPSELSSGGNRIGKVASVVFGYILIGALRVVIQ